MPVTLNELFTSKAHIGHLTRFWNPKMKPFIFGQHNGMHLIDLNTTQDYLEKALAFAKELGARRGSKILFVGTKPIAQSSIKSEAIRAGMPYVDQFWRGGNLTNYSVTSRSIKTLKNMEAIKVQEDFGANMTKKEIGKFERKLLGLEASVGGLKDMIGLPDALFVVDIGKEEIAVREAKALEIPIIGIVDTNHSPEGIDYPIPGNDDASAAIALYTKLVADAILDGRQSIIDLPTGEPKEAQPVINKRPKKGVFNIKTVDADKPST